MKKMTRILMVMLCWVVFVLPVRADVIWEPHNDDFYTKKRENCRLVNRSYTADGPEDKVIVYKSPENPSVVDTWENGHVANIYYTWTDEKGIVWGMYNDWETNETGWVPMEYMEVVYDYICFEEEFGEHFVDESVAIPEECAGTGVYFWSYPGAETYLEIPMPETAADMPQCSPTFVDEGGRKWGYIGYFRGTRNKWVCLDEPAGDFNTLYPEEPPVRTPQEVIEEAYSEEEPVLEVEPVLEEEHVFEEERIAPAADGGTVGLIICLVLGVCGATGGALVGMKKKKDKK